MADTSTKTEPATALPEEGESEAINPRMIAKWANAERSFLLQETATLARRRAKLMLIAQAVERAQSAGKAGDVEALSREMVTVSDLRKELEQ